MQDRCENTGTDNINIKREKNHESNPDEHDPGLDVLLGLTEQPDKDEQYDGRNSNTLHADKKKESA